MDCTDSPSGPGSPPSTVNVDRTEGVPSDGYPQCSAKRPTPPWEQAHVGQADLAPGSVRRQDLRGVTPPAAATASLSQGRKA